MPDLEKVEAELRACPCCCGKARVIKKKGTAGLTRTPFYRETMACKACGLQTAAHKVPGKGVAAWNRRADDPELSRLREAETRYRAALNGSLVAMTLARALPGVAGEYDFDPAIEDVRRALQEGGNETDRSTARSS